MKIQIADPCSEDWNKMKIGLISRHCASCEKAVMDFTKMDRGEIIYYLLSNSDKSVCGRMNRDQFDFHHDDIPLLIEVLKKKDANRSFLILALVCLSLVSCSEDNASKQIKKQETIEVTGKMAIENVDTSTKDSTKESIASKKLVEPQIKGNIDVLVGEPCIVKEPEPPLMGLPVLETNDTKALEQEEIYEFPEKMPEYKGGIEEMFAFIQANLKYPQYEKENGIQGTVYVRFIVNSTGKLSAFTILRGVKDSPNFDKEVKRILNIMPDWIPAENKGKKVSTYYTLPIKFRLN